MPGDVSTSEVLSIGFVCESEKPMTTISTVPVPTFHKDERGNQYLGCPKGYKDLRLSDKVTKIRGVIKFESLKGF
jgi:hypothetical protein